MSSGKKLLMSETSTHRDGKSGVRVVVPADDFTGACDTGLAFAKAGLKTVVHLGGEIDLKGVDVLVVDTETRNASRIIAEQRVVDAMARFRDVAPRVIYKKVDSALRGHLGSEIRAVMRVFDRNLCVMAPAFPEAGRVTVGGYHLVHGVPVGRTEVGHDAGAPVRGSYLPHLLESEAPCTIQSLPLEEVARGVNHVASMMDALRGVAPTVIVADAASESDLAILAEACALLDPAPILCGSAGLASHIPQAFAVARETEAVNPWVPGPTLMVLGTNESTTREQVSVLKADGHTHEWEVHVDSAPFAWARPHAPRVVNEVTAQLEAGGDALISLVGLHPGLHSEDASDGIALLAEVAKRVMAASRPATLVVSGGWTAISVARALGATAAEILTEVAIAVPVCRLIGGAYDGLTMVTKGGALGDRNALLKVVEKEIPMEDRESLPLLAITMGDPCGVGPEIIAKALAGNGVYGKCRPVVVGDVEVLRRAMEWVGVELDLVTIERPGDARFEKGRVEVLSPVDLDRDQIATGEVSAEAGRAAAEWVIEAVALAVADDIDGIVTAPLNKEAMNLAGYRYPGHTELLADKSGADRVRLMLASDRLNVAHVTCHVGLDQVSSLLRIEDVLDTITLLREALEGMGKADPSIAVTGLNPHAGENGLFGSEDSEVIRPAVDQAIEAGWRVEGPLPADTTFFKAYDGVYDGVVAMYHDQGHAPVKLVAFDTGVNVTLGLPIVRTSVDHGTAFDIAGKGVAKEGNLLCAIDVGARLARRRRG
ncbi:MAG: 4-hydroxythreonine-4-phosphate dehydrogenase PdxA [Gemmatimonadetes bacterium]|nr:4-hydroxythreonine-4-phosphate dehydrogenase PdxA [Gemmatimonadota bacterium]